MPERTREILDILAEPLALVSPSGQTLEANAAFHELAARHSVEPRLADLFGGAAAGPLDQAAREGRATACLRLTAGEEPRPWFRLSLSGDGGRVAALLTDATEEMAWRRESLERDRELAVLRDVGAALSEPVELETLAERIYDLTARTTHTDNFYVALYDRDSGTVSFPRYLEDGNWRTMTSRPFGNGLTEYVLRTGAPLLLNRDVLEQARAMGIEPIGRPCRAWVGVPMAAGGETIGVLALQDYRNADRYEQRDVEMLSIIAGQAAAAIRSTRLLAGARRAYEELAEAQAQLLDAERVRWVTDTVGGMNHDLNNPLAAIAGNAQLLLRRADAMTPEARAKVESILEATRRIQQVTGRVTALIQATARPYPRPAGMPTLDLRTPPPGPAAPPAPDGDLRAA